MTLTYHAPGGTMGNAVVTHAPWTAGNHHDQRAFVSPATRHLCVGVYVDRPSRDSIIRRIHNDSRRRVAPSYGFDLVPVVRHAWRSWFLDLGLGTAIVGCLVGGTILGGLLTTVVVVCAVAACALVPSAARAFVEVIRFRVARLAYAWFRRGPRKRSPGGPTARPVALERHLVATASCIAVAALAPMVMSNVLGLALRDAAPWAVLTLSAMATCGVVAGVLHQLWLNSIHHAESLRPERMSRRECVIDVQQSHPCVVYPRPVPERDEDPLYLLARGGVVTPFVGAGKLVHRWLPPMAVQLLRRRRDGKIGRAHV